MTSRIAPVLLPVLAGAVGSAVKLTVAVIAFTGAYMGAPGSGVTTTAAGPMDGQSITLSAREEATASYTATRPEPLPCREEACGRRPVVVELPESEPCSAAFAVRSVLTAKAGVADVRYSWHLMRRDPATGSWEPHAASGRHGFTVGPGGETRPVEWRARVADNPGRYRAELVVLSPGGIKVPVSAEFRVGC
ncbi:hypothetical protein [Rhizohabitans arisaemae]|uniref:hypothetical protein n=1 Tax=Rhizohabitans arisaemae TaxID=2720610 RepID=UPI0024B0EFC2|nr:hypothetical protein [Rhizohabitans arisaemae]